MSNIKPSKVIFSTIISIILMTLATPASAKSVNDIIKEYYPIYNKTKQCQGIMANNGSSGGEGELYQSGYCIKIDRQLKVQTKQGTRLYVAVTGEIGFNDDGSEAYGAHVYTGLVGMLILKPKGDGWEVEYANPAMNAGSFGKGLKDWKLIQVAPDIWSFVNIHSDSHSDQSFSEYVLLTPQLNSKRIMDSHLTASIEQWNESSAPSGCSKDKKVKYCALLKSKLNVDKTKTINGFYPLKITVNGHEYNYDGTKKRTYKNNIYEIKYTPKLGYKASNDYPLIDVF